MKDAKIKDGGDEIIEIVKKGHAAEKKFEKLFEKGVASQDDVAALIKYYLLLSRLESF